MPIFQAAASIYMSTSTPINLADTAASATKALAANPIWTRVAAMPIMDIVLGLMLVGFVIYGLYFGLIRTLGSLLGVVIGAFVASHYYLLVSDWVKNLFFGYDNLGKVIVFILLFCLVNRLVCLVFMLLDRFFDILAIIPFLKTINHLAGAILGLIEGALVLGLILFVASKYTLLDNWFGGWLADSHLAPSLVNFAKVLWPLLPEVLRKAQSIIPAGK